MSESIQTAKRQN